MMHSPLSLEVYASDLMRSRLQQAAQDALADQLPHTGPLSVRSAVVARHQLAHGLRALARRLDPCVGAESSLVVAAHSR
jgi:hypothetical protein